MAYPCRSMRVSYIPETLIAFFIGSLPHARGHNRTTTEPAPVYRETHCQSESHRENDTMGHCPFLPPYCEWELTNGRWRMGDDEWEMTHACPGLSYRQLRFVIRTLLTEWCVASEVDCEKDEGIDTSRTTGIISKTSRGFSGLSFMHLTQVRASGSKATIFV